MNNEENQAKAKGRPKGQSKSQMQCVGYLPPDELEKQLRSLQAKRLIGHWWFVQHEADEDANKPHCHVRICPPPSRTVDWADIVERVQCKVEGEDLPRRLVLGKGGINDQEEDGLLYARHDARYIAAKGLRKATQDIPREKFRTDSPEWLDDLWNKSEQYQPTPRRLSVDDVLNLVEAEPGMSAKKLLCLCLRNGLNKGQWDMLKELQMILRGEARAKQTKAKIAKWFSGSTPDSDPEPPDDEYAGFDGFDF